MGRGTRVLAALTVVLGLSGGAAATLIDNGDGTITDTDRGIMWLRDANYAATQHLSSEGGAGDADGLMTWDVARAWVEDLVYAGYDDWRLPTALNPDGSGPSIGWNVTGSEMGHLYYAELGGTAGSSLGAIVDPDLALFENIQSTWGYYWSGTQTANNGDFAWGFTIPDGYQARFYKLNEFSAWPVRDADVVPTPEPGTMLLLGSGLAGLVGAVRRHRK